jgi:hypothetical protein
VGDQLRRAEWPSLDSRFRQSFRKMNEAPGMIHVSMGEYHTVQIEERNPHPVRIMKKDI